MAGVARSSWAHVTPAPTRAIRRSASTSMPDMPRTSMTRPSSTSESPATECPPARTAISRSRSRARASAAITSSGVSQRATSAGRRSIMELKSVHASAYSGSPGSWTAPGRRERISSSAVASVREIMCTTLSRDGGPGFTIPGHLAKMAGIGQAAGATKGRPGPRTPRRPPVRAAAASPARSPHGGARCAGSAPAGRRSPRR
jgi:hypothetical protein